MCLLLPTVARLHKDVMRVLVDEIVAGDLAEGDQLPREEDLAERFSVSRGVARECIRAMEERGLISVVHGRAGATLNGPEEWNVFDADVIGGLLDSPRNVEVLAHYLEFRRIIEVEAAALAAKRARREDIAKMATALERMEAAVGRKDSATAEDLFHQADVAFHQAVVGATRNPALIGMAETIHAALLKARYPLARPQYRTERALPEHRRIFEAIAAGDEARSREAMASHLNTIEGYLGEYSAGDGAVSVH
jgi:DNA-binding FadR family transcriptional regulator